MSCGNCLVYGPKIAWIGSNKDFFAMQNCLFRPLFAAALLAVLGEDPAAFYARPTES